MSWEGTDRRKFPRVIYPCLVKVVSLDGQSQQVLTHSENIGLGGLCVTIKNGIKLFTPVEMEIDLVDLNEHIFPKGTVVWNVRRKQVEEVKPMFYDIGIQFTEISQRDHERLQNTLKMLMEKGTKILKPYI